MVEQVEKTHSSEPPRSLDDVKRVLEVGRILLSVLTPEELEELGLFIL